MKKQMFYIMAIALIAGAMVTGCNSPTQKVENAKDKVDQAKDDLDQAKHDYLAEVESFKKEKREQAVTNDQRIAELKARIAKEKDEVRVKFDKRIAELEKKNSELKASIDDYKDEGKENWTSFKDKFNRDMENLGTALRDFFRDNQK